MSDDTQDANHEPGDPAINLDASNLPGRPGIPSPYPPSRADWFDVGGIYEVKDHSAEQRAAIDGGTN